MPDLEMIFEEEWSTYEEWGAVRIFTDQNDCVYVQHGGYSVMSDDEGGWADLELISWEQAVDLVTEWEEIAAEFQGYFD